MQSQPANPAPANPILALTGHRPAGLSLPGKPYNYQTWHIIAGLLRAQFTQLQPRAVISGLALGFDTIGAEIAVELEIPLICAIPYPGQAKNYTAAERALWLRLQKEASQTEIISYSYSPSVFHDRDRWMVDHAQAVLALCHGRASGTQYTIDYAQSKGRPVINLWSQFGA